jgi:YVTN family beta-propeller protein
MRMSLRKLPLLMTAIFMFHCKSYEESFNRNINSTGVYVTNSGSNTITQFSVDPGTGVLNNLGTVAAGTTPYHIVLNSAGTFAYVVNSGSNDVYVYSVNKSTRKLTFASSVAAGTTPRRIVFHRSGSYAYVMNEASTPAPDISKFFVDATTGALSSLGAATAVGGTPVAAATFLDSVYVAVSNATAIRKFDVTGTTGAIAADGTTPAATIAGIPADIAILPLTASNAMIYAPINTNLVEYFPTAGWTGTPATTTIASGNNPGYLGFNATQTRAIVANFSAGTLSVYSISTGVLAASATIDACTNPGQIVPIGTGLIFVSCYGAAKINVYSAANLSLVNSAAVGTSPTSIAGY